MIIDTFEGEYVRVMRGRIPGITLQMDQGFPRGTHVKLAVEARVRNVGYSEATDKDNKGELVRDHQFVIEEVKLLDAMTAEEADPGAGGGASRQFEESFDFGPVIQDCWFEAKTLTLHHKGGCDICYPHLPEGVAEATVRASLDGGLFQPPADPGF